jgi:GNAT superfamily N-acetyltransferase
MASARLVERVPTADEYLALREAVGWGRPSTDAVSTAMASSLFSVCLYRATRLIGCGRVIGDGGLYFYIQDMIVLPGSQRRGYGRQIMTALMNYVLGHARPGAFIGLMAAQGMAPFYQPFGFRERPAERPDMFIQL